MPTYESLTFDSIGTAEPSFGPTVTLTQDHVTIAPFLGPAIQCPLLPIEIIELAEHIKLYAKQHNWQLKDRAGHPVLLP